MLRWHSALGEPRCSQGDLGLRPSAMHAIASETCEAEGWWGEQIKGAIAAYSLMQARYLRQREMASQKLVIRCGFPIFAECCFQTVKKASIRHPNNKA